MKYILLLNIKMFKCLQRRKNIKMFTNENGDVYPKKEISRIRKLSDIPTRKLSKKQKEELSFDSEIRSVCFNYLKSRANTKNLYWSLYTLESLRDLLKKTESRIILFSPDVDSKALTDIISLENELRPGSVSTNEVMLILLDAINETRYYKFKNFIKYG